MKLLNKYICTLLLVLSFNIIVYADSYPAIEHITSENGLSNNTVRCMIQDKTGFIWFGSLNGLNRFDGIKIKSFIPNTTNSTLLSSGKIKELHQDSFGHIWVRTFGDMMHCYNPKVENFIPIFNDENSQFIKFNKYYEDNQKNIWLSSVSSGCIKITFKDDKVFTKTFSTSKIDNKLASNLVNDVFQDSFNNVWILTNKGVTLLQNDKCVFFNKLLNNSYIKVYELNKCLYFISESGTIETYNIKSKKFESTVSIPANLKVYLTSTFKNNKIFISTIKNSVYVFDLFTKQILSDFTVYGESISGNAIFQKDKLGNLWTYNLTGNVWLLSPKKQKVIKFNLIPQSTIQLIDDERYQFMVDKQQNTWISTYGNGLFCYNVDTEILSHYSCKKSDDGLSSNYLLSIIQDKNENIWLGTESMGINKLSFLNRDVQILYPDSENALKNGNEIRAFLEDKNHNIWVATKAGNLYVYDSKLRTKKTIWENGSNVYSMFLDNQNSIWLGTKRNGIIELKNGNLATAINYQNNGKPNSLSNNTVFSMVKDRKGRLWVATFGGGICVKTTKDGTEGFKTFFNKDLWIKFIRYIITDRNGDIWVATNNGVLRFNPDKLLQNPKAYKYYGFDIDSKNCLINPDVRYIFEDSKGIIWLATAGGGLHKFIGETTNHNGVFEVYKNQQGLANDNIMAIQEDKTACLWISTESGLHKFNPKTGLFQYYKFSTNFSSNIYSEAACLTCADGKMLWGSLNGFYAFFPKDLEKYTHEKNSVVLTGFSIYDQNAKIDAKNAPLEQSVSFATKIVLNYSDKVFHIEFSKLNFLDPKANQFMYILKNYERRWNLSGAINTATYRNVPPGKYTFLVKSSNRQGVWDNNVTKLEIEIQPPFWQSNWAFFVYFILLGGALYFAYNLILKFYRLNNAVKVERQLTDYKLRFFTNISHEFRTPLTLIKGSVDTLIELKNKMSEPMQHAIADLDKNTLHLLRLIDQLMEFRKLQNNKQKLNLQPTDAVVFLNEIFSSFTNVAIKTNIQYDFIASQSSIPVFFDKNKVDKIIFNLLSNAFKFTPRGGKIQLIVDVDETAQLLRISVSDNGIGIPKEKQNLLFSRFMQINFSANGTGVGLSLVNEFAALHKGNVQFKENDGGGSIFSVELPLNEAVYTTDEFVSQQIIVSADNKNETFNLSEFIEHNTNDTLINLLPNVPIAGKKYKLLVIDDNDDIREFLTQKLCNYFDVITAEDGIVGIKKSMEDDPDLIICDVMMPGMNGFELTKKLKDDFATCHIPVILLTAYISDEHHTEGVQAGADAYISKPFSMPNLMIQINKLIEKRELLNKHYTSNTSNKATNNPQMEDQHLEMSDRDNHFLVLIEELLEEHLTNPNFSVDEFAQLTNTGRTLFFKKIKFLTGYSPNEFIRYRRMIKAVELLKTYKYNVSQVSYMVGINDPFYFSKCFKTQFGCSPTHYMNLKK